MISAAQKKAKDNFKKAIAYRKKTGCDLKAAFAHVYGRKVGAVNKKATPKKKTAKKIITGIKITRKSGKLGALPVNFTGSILGLPFKVYNQFNLDGSVTLQIVENTPNGYLIAELNGNVSEIQKAADKIWGRTDGQQRQNLGGGKAESQVKKTILDFVKNLHNELKKYNSGKDTRTKKGAKLVIKSTRKKSTNAKDKIKDVLRSEKKRLKYGYTIVPGRVMNGISVFSGINQKKDIYEQLQKTWFYILDLENIIKNLRKAKQRTSDKQRIKDLNYDLKQSIKFLKEQKLHHKELKKLI